MRTNFCHLAVLYLDMAEVQGLAQTAEDTAESCMSWAEGCEDDYSDDPHYEIACFVHEYFYDLYNAEQLQQQREALERSFAAS